MAVQCGLGSAERARDALNAQIVQIEDDLGIPPAESASISSDTWRRWVHRTQVPQRGIAIRALCELAGRPLTDMWWVRQDDEDGIGMVEEMNRREFLSGAGSLALGVGIAGVLAEIGPPPAPNVDTYRLEVERAWRRYVDSDPQRSAYEAGDLVELGRVLMNRSRGADREQLAGLTALAALLTGRIAFFDLGRASAAAGAWQIAQGFLAESSDYPLKAAVHGHQAFVPGWQGRWSDAEKELGMAASYARRGGSPDLRSWLHAVAAENLGRSGRSREGLAEIEKSRRVLSDGGAYPDPWWLDYFDGSRLDGFDAAASLLAGGAVLRTPESTPTARRHARDRVERALLLLPTVDGSGPWGPQDAVTALDRACGHALLEDDDRALELARVACQVLARRPYAAARGRLDQLADILPANRIVELNGIEREFAAA